MNPVTVTVIAIVRAHPEHAATVEAELRKLIPPTLAEPGCIHYDLHRDLAEPHVFVFHENWESAASLDRHLEAAHLAAFDQATQGMIAGFEIRRLQRV